MVAHEVGHKGPRGCYGGWETVLRLLEVDRSPFIRDETLVALSKRDKRDQSM
jgi:hypothetical protein